jgi:hypothetical protein
MHNGHRQGSWRHQKKSQGNQPHHKRIRRILACKRQGNKERSLTIDTILCHICPSDVLICAESANLIHSDVFTLNLHRLISLVRPQAIG